jgi:uroporphyrinogen decarboxylase
MAYSGVMSDIKACVDLRVPSRMPVFALTFEMDLGIAGLSWRHARTDIDRVVRCQLEAVRRFDHDWVMVFPDDYVEFEPLGLKMRDDENAPAMVREYLPMNHETLSRFRFPDLSSAMRIPMHLEWIRRIKQALGETVCVMGRVACPFSTLALIYGIQTLLINVIEDPELVFENMTYFADYEVAYGRAQLDAGADGLWLGDCVAASRFISLAHYEKYTIPFAAEVASKLTSPDRFIIYHSCETAIPYLRLQTQLPASAVNVGERVSMATVRRELGITKCMTGNFDPIMLRDSTPDEIAAQTMAMIRENLAGGGYIFSTGEDTMQTTPVRNLEAMLSAARAESAAVLGRLREAGKS